MPASTPRIVEQAAEHIVPHLAHEGGGLPQLLQHGQHIAGRAAWVSLK